MHDVCNYNTYFIQKYNAVGVLGLLPEQKLTVVLRMLAYGASVDHVDEIVRMGKSTILECLVRFCDAIENLYTRDYLRKPTPRDLQRLLRKAKARDFLEDEYDYDALEVFEPDPMNTALTRIYERPMGANGQPMEHELLIRDDRYNNLMIDRYQEMQSLYVHEKRQVDLIEHLWDMKGNHGG
ncbi:uncharacterized protein LOC110747448 [Prunus avium]|uniref:Uncharacterized protein LOC110747448 n=1 Tax=Prunus avium TaxID=42229 RepID=A0A6P5RKT7_PRUAV|nr:uncharacterized protein LOC110747448 [Prunus avium]